MNPKLIVKLAVERKKSRSDFFDKYLRSNDPKLIYREDRLPEVDALLDINSVEEMNWEGKFMEGTGEWFNGGLGLGKYRRSELEYKESQKHKILFYVAKVLNWDLARECTNKYLK